MSYKKLAILTAAILYMIIGATFYGGGYIEASGLREQILTAIYIIFLWPIPIGMRLLWIVFQ